MSVFYSTYRLFNLNINSLNLKKMKTQILTSYKQEQKTVTKKRINIELICALLTLGAIILTVYILNVNGLIREF